VESGGIKLKNEMVQERVIEVAKFTVLTNSTIRATAKMFGVSKSTIGMDLSKRINILNPKLAEEVKKVLDNNFSEKHVRGGNATRLKYKS
jgi:putative DeoR family transcriptional regulator (stage III sporulation protein D)